MEPKAQADIEGQAASPPGKLRDIVGLAASGPIERWIAAHFPRADPARYSLVLLVGDQPPVAVPCPDPTIYGIGCLQDVLLAAFTIQLEERGLVSLGDRVSAHIPGFLADDTAPVRIGHLLSRSSGLWMPDPRRLAVPLSGWGELRSFLGQPSPRFTPGIIAAHSLLERLVLLRVLEQVLGSDPYEAMCAELWPAGSPMEFRPSGGPFGNCYRQVRCTLGDLAAFLVSSSFRGLLRRLSAASTARYADPAHVIKDWAPKSAALGLFRMENGFWGQDGDDPRSGNLAMRVDADSGIIVLGRFETSVERDALLGLVSADLFGLSAPPRDFRLGTIAGFAIEELAGDYDGMLGQSISIAIQDSRLYIVGLAPGGGALPLDIRPGGMMHSRWAGQTLWIEPVVLPGSGQLAIHLGRHLYLRRSGVD